MLISREALLIEVAIASKRIREEFALMQKQYALIQRHLNQALSFDNTEDDIVELISKAQQLEFELMGHCDSTGELEQKLGLEEAINKYEGIQ